ncbi:MAG TPA: diacylglycerol kinase family lipid kinase [Candidatus Hydrogenedentes bacterium]|nr:diacylglycerol kinase family lipid kinase [Candidatus Hydrogenedentota bacterium]HPG69057.1 diacylglycerol kinase family lipid kinase [Candidatus Hydrogenedentota bacterium]
MSKVRVIVNPISGGGKGRARAEALSRDLDKRGYDVETLVTGRPGDARVFAQESKADVLVAAGGDGTVNEVVNGLSSLDTPVGILPVGAVNVTANELGISRNPVHLANLIASGSTRRMDIGLANDRRFLFCTGAGLDAAIVDIVHANRPGKKMSVAFYVLPAARTILCKRLPKIRVVIDGKVVNENGEYVMVANCRKATGAFAAAAEARIDDGLFDVCILRNFSVRHTLSMLVGTLRPGFAQRPDIGYHQTTQVELMPAGEEPVSYQIDGDPGGRLPVSIRVLPKALRVFAPTTAPCAPHGCDSPRHTTP